MDGQQTCNGQQLKQLAEAGKHWLELHHERVNQLNVFPIPDGDTGINMLLTMRNACNEVADSQESNAAALARQLARGAIMGSRGNSGTIMSRIWSGFAKGLGEAESFNVALAAKALREAATTAYQGVQSPTEGTILTVIREVAEEAEAIAPSVQEAIPFLEKLVRRGWDAVERTPDMLAILKQAGVVDSGGTGLMYILEGMLKHLRGEEMAVVESLDSAYEKAVAATGHTMQAAVDPSNERYNYDVQFVLKGKGLNADQIRADIEAMGDSGVIVGDEQVVKVHIHVDDPGLPISYAVQKGVLLDVVVENMHEQYEAFLRSQGRTSPQAAPAAAAPAAPRLHQVQPGEVGVIAVAAADGLAAALADVSVAGIVEGGQTNNPSTEEILAAVQALNTDKIIILPNNKNIILAAQQAAELATGREVRVIPTRSFPQGLAAMLNYRPDAPLELLAEEMQAAAQEVITAEVTTATRSVELDGVEVQAGQIIGLVEGKLRQAGPEPNAVVTALLQSIDLDDYALVTLYYGAEVSQAEAQALADSLQAAYDALEFTVFKGGQPHYHYIIGVE